jgi:hypothetical protein
MSALVPRARRCRMYRLSVMNRSKRMANGASKLSDGEEFGGSTNVMESGLLRVLKQTSKASDTGGWRAIADEMQAGAVAPPAPEPPPKPMIEVEPDEPEPALSPLVVEASEPPVVPIDRTSVVTVPPPRRRSRVMVIAGIVAVVVLAADASMFMLHRRDVARRAMVRPPAPQPAELPTKLPGYMVLPEHAAWPQPSVAPPPAAASISAPAPTLPSDVGHAHRHSRHRHGKR